MKANESHKKETSLNKNTDFYINWDSVENVMKRKRAEAQTLIKNIKLPIN